MPKNRENKFRATGFAGQVLSIGLTGGICMAISLYLGYEFDLYFATSPVGIIIGIFIGLASGAVQTWKQLKESHNHFEKAKLQSKDKKS